MSDTRTSATTELMTLSTDALMMASGGKNFLTKNPSADITGVVGAALGGLVGSMGGPAAAIAGVAIGGFVGAGMMVGNPSW
jgi:hypothetical protein